MASGGSSTQNQFGQQSSSSSYSTVIPKELKPLYTQSSKGMQNLQNLAPLWGTQETTLKEGATPAAINYKYIPGTPGTPASTQQMYYDQNGQLQVLPAGYSIGTISGATPAPDKVTAAVAGTPGYYDYNSPIFTYNPEDYETKQLTPNYLAANPMQTAGLDPLQDWAAQNVTNLTNTPQGEQIAAQYGALAPLLAGRMATGAGAATDPAVLAAQAAFEKLTAPQIENQMGLAGLGKSSSLGNAMSLGNAQMLTPLIMDYINREQSALTNQANMYASLMPQFSALGGAETARMLNALNDAMQIGGVRRGVAQEPLTAEYQDFLRRQALAEQALFVPFGATAGASIGPAGKSESQGSTVGSSQMSQGMFK